MEYYSIPAQKKKDILHPKVATQQSCLPFVPKSIAENTSQSIYGKRRKKVLLNVSYILCSMPHLSFVARLSPSDLQWKVVQDRCVMQFFYIM